MILACGLSLSVMALAGANLPPDAPPINEPELDGQIVNPSDVHMEAGPFSDPDAGDQHLCSDYEIWTTAPDERVWFTSCIGGVEKVHSHLGDGIFENSHAGLTQLLHDTNYRLRVRFRDDSGDGATDWSDWSERMFTTASPADVLPLEVDDIADAPEPRWSFTGGAPVVLPPGAPAPKLVLESSLGDPMLLIAGFNGVTNLVIDFDELDHHEPVRVRVEAGNAGRALIVPASNLTFLDHECRAHTILLPALDLAPMEQALFWVSFDGATYTALPGEPLPDFSDLLRGLTVPWAVHQPGFALDVVAGGFQLPVNLAFLPNPGDAPGDPLFYVNELYGTIRVVTRDGSVGMYAEDLIDFEPTGNFPGSGEQGLTGIAVDPATGDVYVALLYDSPADPGTHYPRVDRFTSLDGGLTAATQTTVLDMAGESQGQSHQISNLTIGPDGQLYVHMGDGFNAGTAQDLDSFRGKILRLELNGLPSPDNPYYNEANGITARDYVWTSGLRNPFGGGWREADGAHYEVENGPSRDRLAKQVGGTDYGWTGSNGDMSVLAIHNWEPAVAPVNIVFVQPGVFSGSGFPAEKMDHAFITESGPTYGTGPQTEGKRIREYVINGAGTALVREPEPFIEYVGTGKATAVALAAGPDGLYFSDLYRDDDDSPQTDDFAARYTGEVEITQAANWTFLTESDDGSMLWIDGDLVVNNDGLHSMITASGSLFLDVGMHDIEVRFFERGGGAGLIVSWDPPGPGGAQVIPAGALTHDGAMPGLVASYFELDFEPSEIADIDWNAIPDETEIVANIDIESSGGSFWGDPGQGPTAFGAQILRVRYVEPQDCNGNGIADDCDIVEGAADANRNGIPDVCEPCASADFDGSGEIGFGDLLVLLSSWGACGPGPCPWDLDGSGDVGFGDLLSLLSRWGLECP